MNRGRISPPLFVMTTTFVRQLFLPFAVRSVLPLRVAVHRVVPLPAWLVPAKRLSFPRCVGVAFRTLHSIRLGYWQVLRAYAFGRSQATGRQ